MILAIDIGGTKTLIALFGKGGRVVKKHKFKTPKDQREFLTILTAALTPFSQKYGAKIEHITIAVPGWIENNIAVKFGNRPWKNLDLEKSIKNLFNCEIKLENDASLGTVYESSFHKGLTLYLTFSTGIGGGLSRKGVLAKNTNSVEPGHTIYIWEGQAKEWEDIASCAAIGSHYGTQATSVRGAEAYADIARRVSLGFPQLIQKYHPDTIIIGGPLGLQYPHFKDDLKKHLKTYLRSATKLPRIVAAKRPKEAVIYGCYLYSKTVLKRQKHKTTEKSTK